MKNDLYKINDRAQTAGINPENEELYLRKISTTPTNLFLLIEYILFSFYKHATSNYSKLIDSLIKLTAKKTNIERLTDTIFNAFNFHIQNHPEYGRISPEIRDKISELLTKLYLLNPKGYDTEKGIINIAISSHTYQHNLIKILKQEVEKNPAETKYAVALTTIYSHFEQYKEASAVISTMLSDDNSILEMCFLCDFAANRSGVLPSKIAKSLHDAIATKKFRTKTLVTIASIEINLGDYITARNIYAEIKQQIEQEKEAFKYDFKLSSPHSLLQLLKVNPKDPLIKNLSAQQKEEIKNYENLNPKQKETLIDALSKRINDLIAEQSLMREEEKTYKIRDIAGDKNKLSRLKTLSAKKILTRNEKEYLRELNTLLLQDLYFLITKKDVDNVLTRTQANTHVIEAMINFRERKTKKALENLEQTLPYLEKSAPTIGPDPVIGATEQEFYSFNSEDVKGLIDKTKKFLILEELFTIKNLKEIKDRLDMMKDENPLHLNFKKILDTDPLNLASEYAFTMLSQAFNFRKIDFLLTDAVSGQILNQGFLDIKRFIDQIVNFCFRLQKYANLEEAQKDEQQLMQEFGQINSSYHDLFQYLDAKFDQTNAVAKEGLGEIKQILEEPPKTQHYQTDYKIKITQYKNNKGLLEVFRAHQRFTIPITKRQTGMLILMAKNLKTRDKDKPDKDKGWTGYSDYRKGVPDWGETTDELQIRNQISAIKKALKRNTINPFLIENKYPIGYRLSLPPSNISIEK